MANMATAVIVGRIITDPESRVLPNSGVTVTSFRMASGRSKKDPNTGGWIEDANTLYIDVKAFDYPDSKRKLGEVVTKYAKKGDPIACQGDLQTESWEDKSGGGKRSKVVLKVNDVQLLGGKGGGGSSDDGDEQDAPRQHQQQPARQQQPQRPAPSPQDAEIPF